MSHDAFLGLEIIILRPDGIVGACYIFIKSPAIANFSKMIELSDLCNSLPRPLVSTYVSENHRRGPLWLGAIERVAKRAS